jgi:hypothetical protein
MEAVTAVNSGMFPEESPPIPHNAVHHRDAVLHTNSGFWKNHINVELGTCSCLKIED